MQGLRVLMVCASFLPAIARAETDTAAIDAMCDRRSQAVDTTFRERAVLRCCGLVQAALAALAARRFEQAIEMVRLMDDQGPPAGAPAPRSKKSSAATPRAPAPCAATPPKPSPRTPWPAGRGRCDPFNGGCDSESRRRAEPTRKPPRDDESRRDPVSQ